MRLKSIEIRQQLTDEWKNRSVEEGKEYSILTAEIARATFGLTPAEHRDLKGLERENLRDHMTNLELIFTMLGEESTRQIATNQDAPPEKVATSPETPAANWSRRPGKKWFPLLISKSG